MPDRPRSMEEIIAEIASDFTPVFGETEGGEEESGRISRGDRFIRQFRMKPSEMVAYLKRYVVKQDEAIRVLATKICGHYNAIRLRLERKEDPMKDIDRIKSNVILIGPTGVGKTYLVKLIAQKLGVPFIKVDATKYTEAGYVGGDVEDIIRDLAGATKDRKGIPDIALAQYGIVFIDEGDKIASSGTTIGPDVSRKGVQRALLSIIEEADVALVSRLDIAGQAKMAMRTQYGQAPEKDTINTRNILFIFAGAFNGLEGIIKKRTEAKKSIGFQGETQKAPKREEIIARVSTDDLINFGFEPEFIGRIPVRVGLEELNDDDLFEILKIDNSPIVRQFEDVMESYGIQIEIDEGVLKFIACEAAKEKTGARGLVSAFNSALGPYESAFPDIPITEFRFTLPMVDGTYDKTAFIKQLKAAIENKVGQARVEREEMAKRANSAQAYAKEIFDKYGLHLKFDGEFLAAIEQKAAKSGLAPQEVCRQIFGIHEDGFRLLALYKKELILTQEAMVNTVSFLEKAFKA